MKSPKIGLIDKVTFLPLFLPVSMPLLLLASTSFTDSQDCLRRREPHERRQQPEVWPQIQQAAAASSQPSLDYLRNGSRRTGAQSQWRTIRSRWRVMTQVLQPWTQVAAIDTVRLASSLGAGGARTNLSCRWQSPDMVYHAQNVDSLPAVVRTDFMWFYLLCSVAAAWARTSIPVLLSVQAGAHVSPNREAVLGLPKSVSVLASSGGIEPACI